jgi:hypothetical protein
MMKAAGPALPAYFGFDFDKNGNLLVTETFSTFRPSLLSGLAA